MNQQPVPAFTTDPTIGTPGEWIRFDASTSSDLDGIIASYAWNFGDGRTGTGGPVFWQQYTSAGMYAVTLTVTDNLGATAAVTRIAQVGSMNQSPTASFAVLPPAPSVAAWARFDATASTDPDGTIVSYQWSFGDGTTAYDTVPVTYHQFMAAGTFLVTLTVTDNGGTANSSTQPVQVGTPMQAPVASFTFSPSSPIVGSPVVFNASSSYDPDGWIVSHQWDLNGDGTVDTTGATAQAIYSSPRTAVVRLTVTDNSGLSTSATQTIVVSLSGGGPSGAPAMGTTAGFFVWGSDTWHVTVNAGAGWIAPHNYRIELRTDGQFSGLNESWSGGVAPMGIVPTPPTGGKTLILEGSIQAGSVDYSFTIPVAKSMWMSFKMDQNGDGTLEESASFVYLRYRMVHPPANPFVVGLPSGTSGSLIPSLNFRIGTAWTYTETSQFVFWSTTIGALESL
jgi:PKD repeat protein